MCIVYLVLMGVAGWLFVGCFWGVVWLGFMSLSELRKSFAVDLAESTLGSGVEQRRFMGV